MSKVEHMSDKYGDTHRWFCKCGDAQHIFETGTDAEFYGDDLLVTIYSTTAELTWDPREWRNNLYILKTRIKWAYTVLSGGELAWTEVVISSKDRQAISDAVQPIEVADEKAPRQIAEATTV